MIVKRLLRPERLRRVPQGFNWVDHRLVSQNFLARCDHHALALYLFLITVSDVQGMSFYSDGAIQRRLKMSPVDLAAARAQLAQADMLAWQKPLYQVLSLDTDAATAAPQSQRSGQTQSLADVLRRAFEKGDLK
jgi:hypothetical protein